MPLYRLTLKDENGGLSKVEVQAPNVLAVLKCHEDSS
jgi:hypothetical protein